MLMSSKQSRLRLTREKGKNRIGHFRTHRRHQLLSCCTPNSRETAELREQRFAPRRTDARHQVELRMQIAQCPGFAVKGHGKAVRFIANPRDQQQCRIVSSETYRIVAI